jgi:hypothetical protein
MQTYGTAPQRVGTAAPKQQPRGLIGKAMAKPTPKPAPAKPRY